MLIMPLRQGATATQRAGLQAACRAKGDANGTNFIQNIDTTDFSGTFSALYPALRPPTQRRLDMIPRTGYPAVDLKSTYCFCAHMHEIIKYFLLTENQ